MKKFLTTVLCTSILLMASGCEKNNTASIVMTCNEEKATYSVKVDDKLKCKLLGDTYEFTVKEISKDNISIEANNYGLTSKGDLLEKVKDFNIKKDEKLELSTQSTDYQEKVTFEIEK